MAELQVAMRLETHFDKAFVISIKRRQDRLGQFWQESDSQFGLPDGFIKLWQGFDNPNNGHAGCTRSHRELLAHIAKSDYNRVLVFEDDASALTEEVFRSNGFTNESKPLQIFLRTHGDTASERFHNLNLDLPEYDVLYLGGGYREKPISRHSPNLIRCGQMLTTSSYGITREFARVWTDTVGHDLESHPGQIDCVFSNFAHTHRYYCIQPRLFYQRMSMSDTAHSVQCHLMSMTDETHESLV